VCVASVLALPGCFSKEEQKPAEVKQEVSAEAVQPTAEQAPEAAQPAAEQAPEAAKHAEEVPAK
jgi:hypothetical protein